MKLLIPLAAACLAPVSALAQVETNVATVTVLPGWSEDDGTRWAGFQISLEPGWKTYWRAPGDAGIPPQVSFAGSNNLRAARMAWPVPVVFDQNGMQSIGYTSDFVVPLALSPDDAAAPMRLAGTLQIGVCEEICIPISLDFNQLLPPGGSRDPAIVASVINRPRTADEAKVTAATCAIAPGEDGITLTASLTMPSAGVREVVVIEAGDPKIWVSQADTLRDGSDVTAVVDMVHMHYESFVIDRSAVRITVLGSDYAVDIQGCDDG